MYESSNGVYEPRNVDTRSGRFPYGSCSVLFVPGATTGVSPELKEQSSTGVQPVSTRDSPRRFGFRDSEGPAGGFRYRTGGHRGVAGVAPNHLHRSAAHYSRRRI